MPLRKTLYPLLHEWLRESRPRHLSLGIALGFALGGFPFATLQWLVVAALCVVMRAQTLGVLVGAGLSGLLVFASPDLLHWLGWRVLIPVPNVHGFWASLYNAPLLPFTHFNETVSMGRSLLTLLLTPFVYLASLRLFLPLDGRIQAWVQDTLGLIHWRAEHSTLPPEAESPNGWYRPRAHWAIAAIGVAFGLWYAVGFESYFKTRLETAASRLNAAPVKIRDLDFSLFRRRLELRGIEVGHHTAGNTNRFELDSLVVEFMATPLLYRKFVIKNIYTNGLHANTHRSRWEEEGQAVDTAVGSLIDRVAAGVFRGMRGKRSPFSTLSNLNAGLNLNRALSETALETEQQLENVQAEWKKIEQVWTEKMKTIPDAQWFAQQAVARQPAASTDPVELAERIRTVRKSIGADYTALIEKLNTLARPLPTDLKRVRKLLSIPDLSQKDMTWMIFSSETLNYLERLIYWVEASRKYMPPAFERSRIPISIHPSDNGQVIHFHRGGGFATFLLINGELTSKHIGPNSVVAKGKVAGLTTNPPGWALPARVQLDAAFPHNLDHLKLDAVIDHTSTSPRETVRLDFEGLNITDLELHRGRDLQFHLKSPEVSGSMVASFAEESLNVEWKVKFSQAHFDIRSPNPELELTLKKAVKEIYQFEMNGRVEGPLDRPHVQAKSYLGQAIADALRARYHHEIGAVDDNILRNVQAQIAPLHRTLRQRVENAYTTAWKRLDAAQARLAELSSDS